jgi:uncharacterized protein Smg (DUF494 family)
MAMALKVLNPEDDFEEILTNLGLSTQDFLGFLESLSLDFQISILTLEEVDKTKTRVFSRWEQAFLTKEARDFLLSALDTKAIAPSEMEQALAILFATSPEFADVEEVCGVLENIVEDPGRVAVLGSFNEKYIH